MKKLCLLFSIILCMTAVNSNIYAFADTADDDNILTLEEAKALALKNDVQFNLQQGYIQNASENYEDVYESNSRSDSKDYSNVADRAKAEVSRKIAIENAASSVRKAVFARNNLKRESDYAVTSAYNGVIKAKLALEDAEQDKVLSNTELETAKIKYSLNLITKKEFSAAEDAYQASIKACDNAFTEVQKSMIQLSNSIGKTLDVFNDQIDLNVSVPDIKSLDLNKIKEDYMKNNSSYFSAKESYDMAEYQLQLTEDKFDYYYKRLPHRTTALEDKLEDMLADAQREFNDAKYSYEQKENDLDATLSSQYISINKSYDSYLDLLKDLEEEKQSLEESKIKNQMGLVKKAELNAAEANIAKLENKIQSSIADLISEYVNMTQYSID